jgi:hypothetical protein
MTIGMSFGVRHGYQLAVAGLFALLACGGSATASAASHPDFTGVYTFYPEPGKRAFGREKLDLPFTPAGRAQNDAYQALVSPTSDNPGAHCLGSGMPEAMTFAGAYPMEIVQRPEQVVVIYEAHTEVRHLYFKDKVIPEADRVPARGGYSTARWDASVLIVETDALKDQPDSIYPHSATARIVEKYHWDEAAAKGTRVLVDEWQMTDPITYTKPIGGIKKWLLEPKGFLLPYECDEEGWLDHLEELKKLKSEASGSTKK